LAGIARFAGMRRAIAPHRAAGAAMAYFLLLEYAKSRQRLQVRIDSIRLALGASKCQHYRKRALQLRTGVTAA
jgi:hypothetical protein